MNFDFIYIFQAEVFPYPEISNEELEEMNQLVQPVEKFFSEDGGYRWCACLL